jgi:uncharacterized protein YjbI with pentapeptide repeats
MDKRRHLVRFRLLFPLAALLAAILACNESHTVVKPDFVKDQDLSNRNWYFSSFCDLDLSGKNLSQSNLRRSLFQKVNLEGADFREADLLDANFQYANLRGADLTGANLNYANFLNADLTDAVLDEKWAKIMPILVSGNGQGAQLQGYDLRNIDFQSPDVWESYCDFDIADWYGSFIFNLSEANLEKAFLDESILYHVNLTNANLRYASLIDTNLQEVNLQNANLEGANLQKTDFFSAHLTGANFSGANLTETNFYHADLQNADLRQAIVEKTDFQYANLTGSLIDQQQLQNAILRCTILPNRSLYKAEECEGQTPGAGELH